MYAPSVVLYAKRYPLGRRDLSDNLHLPRIKTSSRDSQAVNIKGLQKNNVVEIIADGVQQFQLHNLVVRILILTKQITIINLLNNQAIYCDCQSLTLQTETTTVCALGNQPLSFRESQGKYHGKLSAQPIPCLELNLETYSKKITIEFTNL